MVAFLSSLRVRLVLLVLLAATPALALIFYDGAAHRREAIAEAEARSLEVAQAASAHHKAILEEARQHLRGIVTLPQSLLGDPGACEAFLAELVQGEPWYINLGVAAPSGDVVCNAVPLSQPVNVADRGYFQEALQKRAFSVGEYQVSFVTGKPSINAGYPILDAAGSVLGVAFAAIDLSWFGQLAPQLALEPGQTMDILDRNGAILAHYPPREESIGQQTPDWPAHAKLLAGGRGSVTEAEGPDGESYIYAVERLGGVASGFPVYVVVSTPKEVVLSGVNRDFRTHLLYLALAVVAVTAIGLVAVKPLVTGAVDSLVGATRRMAAGDLAARAGMGRRRDELGVLAASFDQMAASLQDRNEQQKRVDAELRARTQELDENVKELRHLTGVLKAIRNVNQLITTERDAEKLIQKACDLLVEGRDFPIAWIVLVDATGKPTLGAVAGQEPVRSALAARIPEGVCPECVARATQGKEPLLVYRNRDEHAGCPLADLLDGGVFVARLGTVDKPLGVLGVAISSEAVDDLQEQGLVRELASDIALALSTLESERARRQSEELFRSLLESTGSTVIRVNREGKRTFVSAGSGDVTGEGAEELLAGRFGDTIASEDRERAWALLQETFRTGRPVRNYITRHIIRGEERWHSGHWVPIKDALGNVVEVQTNSTDVTELVRTQEALRWSEAYHREAVTLSDLAMARFDREGRRVFVDEALANRMGVPKEELLRGVAFDHSPPEDREELWRLFRQCVETGQTITGLMTRIPRDGRMLYLRANLAPTFGSDGRVNGVQMASLDVTDLMEAQERLRTSEELYRSVTEATEAGIARFDLEGRRTFVNEVFARRAARSVEQLLQGRVGDLQQGEDAEKTAQAFRRCKATGQPVRGVVTKEVLQGNAIFTRSDFTPVRDASGTLVGVQCTDMDITPLMETQERLRRSEELYRSLNEMTGASISRFDTEGRRTFVNEVFLELYGGAEHDWIGGALGDGAREEDRTWLWDRFRQCVETSQPVGGDVKDFSVQGQVRYFRSDFTPVKGPDQGVVGVQITSIEITELMKAQEALIRSEALYRSLLDSSGSVTVRVDRDGRRTFISENTPAMTGRSKEEMAAGRFADDVVEEDRKMAVGLLEEVFRTGQPKRNASIRYKLGGSIHHMSTNFEPIGDAQGDIVEVQVTSTDTTHLVEALEALRRSEEMYRSLVESTGATVIRVNREGKRTFASVQSAVATGQSAEELLAGRFGDTMVPEDRERAWALLQETFRTGQPVHNYVTRQVIGGEERYISAHWVPIKDALGNVVEVQTSSVDITELIQAQESLRQSEEMYRSLVDSTGGWVMRVDREGRRTFISGSAARMLGRTANELRAGRFWDTLIPEDAERVRALLRETFNLGNPVRNFLTRQRVGDGTRYIMSNWEPIKDAEGHVVEVQSNSMDATDQVRLQQQFAQAQKMESVGRLAGGVAHDFNNMLTAILGYSEMALDTLPERSLARGYLREVQDAGNRAANLTRQLLAFSRRQVIEPRTFNPNGLVADLQKMLRRLIGEDVEFVTLLAPDAGSVRADPGQLEQVLINLAVNSRDAMPRGGKLTIETANATLDEEYTRTHEEVSAGEYVLISVRDTGAGMSDEVKAHLFEPFFTTKAQGQGTGLGLATCYGIVKQAGGHIEVESALGRGTTMKVFLPRIPDAAREKLDAGQEAAPPGGAETVLLVEDEATVRSLTTRSLRARGYTVLAAANGDEALRVAQEHSEPIHLLFTDVVMPEMDGKLLAERLKALHPETRVLFTSGYTDEAISHRGVLEPGVAFLQKPFSSAALLRKIRDALDQPPSGD